MNDIKGPGELNFESNNLSEAWVHSYFLGVKPTLV